MQPAARGSAGCECMRRRRFLPNTGDRMDRFRNRSGAKEKDESFFGRRYMLSASHRLHTPALSQRAESAPLMASATTRTGTATTTLLRCWWAERSTQRPAW